MTGTITHLWTSPSSGQPMMPHEEAAALANHGLATCAHARPGRRRQVLLVESEILAEFGLQPGQIKENITTQGIRVQGLAKGTLLQVGEGVILEIVVECEPCWQMDAIRQGLQAALDGKRGMLAKVKSGGPLRVGDPIRIMG